VEFTGARDSGVGPAGDALGDKGRDTFDRDAFDKLGIEAVLNGNEFD
jgi:hypothetical protein